MEGDLGLNNNLKEVNSIRSNLIANMNYVEFCVDNCTERKYENFNFSKEQNKCLENCFFKLNELNKIFNSSLKSELAKTE
jgi:hypothetical protein